MCLALWGRVSTVRPVHGLSGRRYSIFSIWSLTLAPVRWVSRLQRIVNVRRQGLLPGEAGASLNSLCENLLICTDCIANS